MGRNQKIEYMELQGGLDTETPDLKVGTGRLKSTVNYEEDIEGGYKPILGYERYDGQASPSDADYALLPVIETGSFSVGDTITGADSSETAVVIALDIDADSTGNLVITKASGTFNASEVLNVSASPEGNTTAAQSVDGETDNQLHAQYKNLAADNYRADIAAIPGSGNVTGGFEIGDTQYGIRNNAGDTAGVIYKESASGWTLVDLGEELSFTSGGTAAIAEQDTITGATSTETATVERVIVTSGTFAGGDAAGKLILSAQSGPFQSENLDTGTQANIATIAGDSSAITLQPDGKLDWDVGTFGDGQETRIYGADGVSRSFEFDGTILTPIDTGMTTDTPARIHVHTHHLFLSFTGGSVQNSAIGEPYLWSPVLGANEMVCEDEVTAFTHEPGEPGSRDAAAGSLVVLCRNTVYFLYGTSTSDFNLVKYRQEVGGFPWSIQDVGKTMMMDDQGIRDIFTAQEFGNFQHSTLSDEIKRWINERKTLVNASCLVRSKNQYRLFFSDDYALYTTMHIFSRHDVRDPTNSAMMPCLFAHAIEVAWSTELSTGAEAMFFGSDDGMVYQMDKGTSFDGEPITAKFITAYHHFGSPRVKKRWRGGMLEVDGDGYAELVVNYKLNYGDAKVSAQPAQQTHVISFRAGKWDTSGAKWDSGGQWDALGTDKVEFDVDGSAENIAMEVSQSSDYYAPIRITGILLRQNERRVKR